MDGCTEEGRLLMPRFERNEGRCWGRRKIEEIACGCLVFALQSAT